MTDNALRIARSSSARRHHSRAIASIVLAISLAAACSRGEAPPARDGTAVASGILKVEELSFPAIDALDRERTLIILPVGILEEHGPHLPVGADSLAVLYEADGASKRVSRALPEWNIVMMPALNYGNSGANTLGGIFVHPGTYAIRQSTLRSVVADIGGQLAQNRFKWIFVLNGHGAPTHNIALNEACDFVSDTFHVTMLHLTAIFRGDAAIQSKGNEIDARFFSAADLESFGMDVHAGVSETSGMLAVRPDLVPASYRELPPRAGRSLEELRRVAASPGWQGYLSAPGRATAEYGRAIEEWWIEGFTELMLRAVRGENMRERPRVPDAIPAAVGPTIEKALGNEMEFQAKLDAWLAQRDRR